MTTDALKRTVRSLKKAEIRIRFTQCGIDNYSADDLVWHNFFSTGRHVHDAKYSLEDLTDLSRQELKAVIEEFYWHVYYRMFKDNYYGLTPMYDVDALNKLGLSPYADWEEIKTRFRKLAKKYHPDAGGSKEEFIEIYKIYESLKNK